MTNHSLLSDEEWEAETIARQKRMEHQRNLERKLARAKAAIAKHTLPTETRLMQIGLPTSMD